MSATTMPELDDRDAEPRTPMKRLGSTRKLAAYNNIRLQLSEQQRWLEARADAQAGVLGELHEHVRRRAELEADYSRALDKLARAAQQRHRDNRHKREEWQAFGTYACWQQVVVGTRGLARDHAALAALYGGRLAVRLQRAADDVLRLHRKCRDMVAERQEEVGAALAEVAAAGKCQAALAGEWRAAALKLRHATDARDRLAAHDPPRPKKLKQQEKEIEKRSARHGAARARALRARADYVLCLEAANATLHRYYVDDLADMIDCMDVGLETVVGRALGSYAAAERERANSLHSASEALQGCVCALDARADKQRFLDAHRQAFMLPRRLLHQGESPEREERELGELAGEPGGGRAQLDAELGGRLAQLEAHVRTLRAECREHAKTLDAAEAELLAQMEGGPEEWEVRGLFGGEGEGTPPPATPAPAPDQEDYYLAKFREYVCGAGRLARLESKAGALRARLGAGGGPLSPGPRRRVRVASGGPGRGQFAAPLEEHLAATRRALPLVLTSCVRVLSVHGLRHQGVFRVSGSQSEMQALRAAFERGEDPLARVRDAADVNSVAGLLKLYLRELRPPLLPYTYRDRLLRLASEEDPRRWLLAVREVVAALPRSSMLVLRYLFAFLSHLAEHSAANMMDAWNLAICVGPTLVAAGGEVHAQNLLNDLVKRIIQHHRQVFPQTVAPHALYAPPPAPPAEGEPGEGEGDPTEGADGGSEPGGGDAVQEVLQEEVLPEEVLPEEVLPEEVVEEEEEEEEPQGEAEGGDRWPPETTPDLVLDLPGDTADTFLQHRDTLRKRTRPAGEAGGEGEHIPGEGEGERSPVPARNTMRVAAKFAELTLTGGSLKPILAAKPALLRRPTPHPRAAPPDTAPPDTAPPDSAPPDTALHS